MKKILNNKIFKVIYTIIKTCIFVVLIGYVAFVAIQRINGNKSIFGYRVFTVATSSMAGVYDVNDIILVKDCNIDNLKVGDDIAYIGSRGGLENKLISHRIVKIEDGDGTRLFITKGVKNDVEDPSITGDQILGEIVGIVPVITQINHIVHTQTGFFFLIFCPIVVVIMLEILQTLMDIKNDRVVEQGIDISEESNDNDIDKDEDKEKDKGDISENDNEDKRKLENTEELNNELEKDISVIDNSSDDEDEII